jgi:hypothetical protein
LETRPITLPVDALSLDKLLQTVTPDQRLEEIKRENDPRRKEKEYLDYLAMNQVPESEDEYQTWLKLQTPSGPSASTPVASSTGSRSSATPSATPPVTAPEKTEVMPPQPELFGTEGVPGPQEVAPPEPKKGFDWSKLAGLGMGLAEIFQAAMAGRQAAMTGQKFDFEGDTTIGRRKAREREDALSKEQEEIAKATRAEDRNYDTMIREADRAFSAEQTRIQQEFQKNLAEASSKEDREQALEQRDHDIKMLAQQLAGNREIALINSRPAGTPGAGADRFGFLPGATQ